MNVFIPDNSRCKTRCLSEKLWKCLVEDPEVCPFCLDVGIEYCCLHQNKEFFREEIRAA